MNFKTIVVSGANGNLGKSVVEYFLSRDWKVIGLVRQGHLPVSEHSNYDEFVVDLSNEVDVQEVVSEIVKKYATIEVLVHTAGGFVMGNFLDTSIQKVRQQLDLNFATAYHLSRPIVAQMLKQAHGNIFFIGAASARYPLRSKGVAAYTLSKSMLIQLAYLIDSEYKKDNIFSHVVMPSIIDTPQNRNDMPNADFSKWESPLKIAQIIEKYIDSEQVEILVSDELKI